MGYELWETQTGNLVASFSHERDALTLVRDAMRQHGQDYAMTLALLREDEAGHITAVAQAGDLIERAQSPA